METGDLDQWSSHDGGGVYTTGTYTVDASKQRAHTGKYSLRAVITTPPTSAVRAFRWKELRKYRELYLGAWFYIPTTYQQTADPCCGRYWDIFQFKSRDDTRIDPFWMFSADVAANGQYYLRAGWGWGGVNVRGPRATSVLGGKNYSQRIAPIPVGRWTHIEAFIRQSSGYDGALILWQDGVKLFDFQNIRTSYTNCDYNDWCADGEWSVNSYSDGLSPSPSTLYVDDAAISTQHVR
jgi:hypothetical protein